MSLSSFLLTDVTVGSTYLKGAAADDSVIVGRVLAILPGIGFRVRDCDGRGHVIWNKFRLVDEAAYDLADEHEVVDGSVPGFPDCEFWEDNGIEPLYVATAFHIYSDHTGVLSKPPGFLTPVLVGNREVAEAKGGAYLRAWTRQMMECLSLLPSRTPGPMLRTPERSLSPLAVPDAPARDAPARAGRLVDDAETETDEADCLRQATESRGPTGQQTSPTGTSEEEEEEEEPEDEEAEEEDQEDEEEDQEDQEDEDEDEVDRGEGGPKIITLLTSLLTSPNFGPIVVVVAWVVFALVVYVQSRTCASPSPV